MVPLSSFPRRRESIWSCSRHSRAGGNPYGLALVIPAQAGNHIPVFPAQERHPRTGGGGNPYGPALVIPAQAGIHMVPPREGCHRPRSCRFPLSREGRDPFNLTRKMKRPLLTLPPCWLVKHSPAIIPVVPTALWTWANPTKPRGRESTPLTRNGRK